MREIVNFILQDSFNSVSICDHWYLLTRQKAQLNASYNRLHQMGMIYLFNFLFLSRIIIILLHFLTSSNSGLCMSVQTFLVQVPEK